MDSKNLNTFTETTYTDHPGKTGWFYLFPFLLVVILISGLIQTGKAEVYKQDNIPGNSEHGLKNKSKHEINFAALLANKEFSKNLRDTVYTDKDLWLELRIDQQTLYVHYRDGSVKRYPVSTGIPGASKSVESRPGLFAIFLKEEVHLSTQFSNARMNYYMPYNMGIGFHGLPGTGYYGSLGKRPSSHGCIRMRNEDVRPLFKQCDIGTLVLSHKGKSVRTVAFAPDGFSNDAELTKEDYIKITAYNLASLMEGKYFLHPPKRFILDGKILPRSGITVSSADVLPDKQLLPFAVAEPEEVSDELKFSGTEISVMPEEIQYVSNFSIEESVNTEPVMKEIDVDPEKVKKYSHNPLGILPYFGPKK